VLVCANNVFDVLRAKRNETAAEGAGYTRNPVVFVDGINQVATADYMCAWKRHHHFKLIPL
jgi:hypothetical protein